MNWQVILAMVGLIKGSNVFKTVGSILHTAGATVAALDSNDTGSDDLAAGAILAVGDGFAKYGDKDSNKQGNIVEALISSLETYKAEMIRCGKITTVNQ